jgi:hypothetical protein
LLLPELFDWDLTEELQEILDLIENPLGIGDTR